MIRRAISPRLAIRILENMLFFIVNRACLNRKGWNEIDGRCGGRTALERQEPSRRRPHHSGRTLMRTWPNSTGAAFSTAMDSTVPVISALISLNTFIASMMQTTVSE